MTGRGTRHNARRHLTRRVKTRLVTCQNTKNTNSLATLRSFFSLRQHCLERNVTCHLERVKINNDRKGNRIDHLTPLLRTNHTTSNINTRLMTLTLRILNCLVRRVKYLRRLGVFRGRYLQYRRIIENSVLILYSNNRVTRVSETTKPMNLHCGGLIVNAGRCNRYRREHCRPFRTARRGDGRRTGVGLLRNVSSFRICRYIVPAYAQ